jgi:hypothetical protein
VFLLCATAYVQSAALEATQEHHHANEHCCLLCHIGPMPVLQTGACTPAVPVAPFGWVARSSKTESVRDVLLVASSSRAPPA